MSSEKGLQLHGQWVAYELRRASRRSVGLTIGTTGLRVSAPRWVPQAEIERLLLQKSAWIVRKLAEQAERRQQAERDAPVWQAGARLAYLGDALVLHSAAQWPPGQARMPRLGQRLGDALYLPVQPDEPPERWVWAIERWLKQQALAHFESRCMHFGALMGVQAQRVGLSQAKTRWGSANSIGHLRLHWRLIHLSPVLVDYVVVHELAHLREMNHSPRFWAIVAEVLPDYLSLRRQLKDIALSQIESVSVAESPL